MNTSRWTKTRGLNMEDTRLTTYSFCGVRCSPGLAFQSHYLRQSVKSRTMTNANVEMFRTVGVAQQINPSSIQSSYSKIPRGLTIK